MARTSKTTAATITKATKKPATRKVPAVATTPAEASVPTAKKLSALDAAARVLAEAGVPMGVRELVEAMATRGYWTSPGGATPHATLASAIIREIAAKGAAARFVKTGKGRFAATATTMTATTTATTTPAATTEPAVEATTKPTPKPAKKGKKKQAAPAEKPADGSDGPESLRELFRF